MKEVRICNCGRIHFLDREMTSKALEHDKDILLICGGCGSATKIGADKGYDWWGNTKEEVYNMYSFDVGDYDFTLDASKFENNEHQKGIDKIVYSVGKRVMMKTGMYARYFRFERFEDNWYPDFYKIKHNDVTVKEIMDFINEWEKDRVTVNMNWLIRSLTDEEAKALSRLYIPAFDWKGTKYEQRWL